MYTLVETSINNLEQEIEFTDNCLLINILNDKLEELEELERDIVEYELDEQSDLDYLYDELEDVECDDEDYICSNCWADKVMMYTSEDSNNLSSVCPNRCEEEPKKTLSDISTLEVGDIIEDVSCDNIFVQSINPLTLKWIHDTKCYTQVDMNYECAHYWWKLKEEEEEEECVPSWLCIDIDVDWEIKWPYFEDEECLWIDSWCCCDWCYDERMALYEEEINN